MLHLQGIRLLNSCKIFAHQQHASTWVGFSYKTPPFTSLPAVLGIVPYWRCTLLQFLRRLPNSQLACSKSLVFSYCWSNESGIRPQSNLSVFEQNESFPIDFLGKKQTESKKNSRQLFFLPESRFLCFVFEKKGPTIPLSCTCQTQQKANIFIKIPSCEELEEVGRTVMGSKGHSVVSIVSSLETAKEEAVCVEERWFPCAWNTMAVRKVALTTDKRPNGWVCAVPFLCCAASDRRSKVWRWKMREMMFVMVKGRLIFPGHSQNTGTDDFCDSILGFSIRESFRLGVLHIETNRMQTQPVTSKWESHMRVKSLKDHLLTSNQVKHEKKQQKPIQ